MYRVTFVILHYLKHNDTMACVNSLLNHMTSEPYSIVVVDNGSPNDSGERLSDQYREHPHVIVLINQENLGYARGNNVGYQYAKYVLESDFIILLNNDTIIHQSDFIERIIHKFDQQSFDVLGPDVISLIDHSHQNPHRFRNVSRGDLRIFIWLAGLKICLNYLRLDQYLLWVINRISKVERRLDALDQHQEREDVVLHGSCLIFSPSYVANYEGLCPKTFMFFEELILHHQAQSRGLKMVYTPDIRVYHQGSASINEIFKSDHKTRRFIQENKFRSARILLQMMKK